MKHLLILLALVLTACGESIHVLSLDELETYPKSCAKKTQQVSYLKKIQQIKNFAEDPDELNDSDREYNSKLKSTIWWFTIKCENEKVLSTSITN